MSFVYFDQHSRRKTPQFLLNAINIIENFKEKGKTLDVFLIDFDQHLRV